jgi:deoxyribonuclease V
VGLRFAEALQRILARIPPGKVATCGTVALALGDVRAARAIADWLRAHPEMPGSHRVVRADRRPVLSPAARLLEDEGAVENNGCAIPTRLLETLPAVPLLRELRAEQRRLASRVKEEDEPMHIERIGGVDVSYDGDCAIAVAVTVDASSLDALEIAVRKRVVEFPYIPTYLAYREFPAIRTAVRALSQRPDVLFVDGHGRLHPSHFGFACYAGVKLDIPTVGIAKHPLAGRPSPLRGTAQDVVPIRLDERVQGFAWRAPGASRPIYVSVGHRITLGLALALTKRATRERYPEPLRIADRISKEERKKNAERSASDRAARPRPPAQRR